MKRDTYMMPHLFAFTKLELLGMMKKSDCFYFPGEPGPAAAPPETAELRRWPP